MKRTISMVDSRASSKSEAEKENEKMLSAIRKRVREQMLYKTKTQVEAGDKTNPPTSNGTDAGASSIGAIGGFLDFEEAKELQQTPSKQLPSFDKVLDASDLSAVTYMDLPKDFCDKHFPKPEGTLLVVDVLLVGEDNAEYAMSYSYERKRFLGKWKDFYRKNHMTLGDVIQFSQIGNKKFKVCKLKADKITRNGGTDGSNSSNLSHLHDSAVRIHHNVPESVNFLDIKDLDAFTKHMNMLIPYSKMSRNLQLRYYELCCDRKMFLHAPVTGLGCKDLATMIEETSRIAWAIKGISIFKASHDLEMMAEKLKSLEESGMEVGFLREIVDKLRELVIDHQSLNETKSQKLAEMEALRSTLQEKGSTLEKLIKSIEADTFSKGRLQVEVDFLQRESKDLDFMFREVRDSKW